MNDTYKKVTEMLANTTLSEEKLVYQQLLQKLDAAKLTVTNTHQAGLALNYSYVPLDPKAKNAKISRAQKRLEERQLKALNAKLADLVKSFFQFCDRPREPAEISGLPGGPRLLTVQEQQMAFLEKLNLSWMNFLNKNNYNVDHCRNMLNQKCVEMIMLHKQIREKEITKLQQTNNDGK